MLSVEGVRVRFGTRWVLDGVDLAVGSGEVVGLLGPSGSGKSTLLRVIAGLLTPDAGVVRWDGVDLAAVPTHRRRFGLVFQDHQLFPHRDVGANVGFGLIVARRPKAEVRARVAELLDLVGLAGFEGRSVAALSGGEAQRVALARGSGRRTAAAAARRAARRPRSRAARPAGGRPAHPPEGDRRGRHPRHPRPR